MNKDLQHKSKFLSLVLRHDPQAAGVSLDTAGWVKVSNLLKGCSSHGHSLTLEELEQVVAENYKKRFQFSDDHKSIRAVQGHSIPVDLGLPPIQPPNILYHGTATRFLDSIRDKGIVKGSRQHVHLSATPETAKSVGKRHGTPAVLPVQSIIELR